MQTQLRSEELLDRQAELKVRRLEVEREIEETQRLIAEAAAADKAVRVEALITGREIPPGPETTALSARLADLQATLAALDEAERIARDAQATARLREIEREVAAAQEQARALAVSHNEHQAAMRAASDELERLIADSKLRAGEYERLHEQLGASRSDAVHASSALFRLPYKGGSWAAGEDGYVVPKGAPATE